MIIEVSGDLNLLRLFGPFRYLVILGLLLLPVFVSTVQLCFAPYVFWSHLSSFTPICMSLFQV